MGAKTRKLSQINDSLIEWQSVVVADGSTGLTAVAGRGYFINTTAGAITVTLPASPKTGDTISIADYAGTFATYNVTININGNNLDGTTTNATLNTNNQAHNFVYIDTTKGWKIINQDTTSSIQPTFITATGGTITTSGNFKIHTFTGDGCFVVSAVGNPVGSTAVDYLVVAGGGGSSAVSGGGAGGFRASSGTTAGPYCAGPSPLTALNSAITVTATTYPITVGAGGTSSATLGTGGGNGTPSTGLGITSTAGGGAGDRGSGGQSGGSGGGAGDFTGSAGGSGNTPPVSPPQGNNGGAGAGGGSECAGGGGGAATAGTSAGVYGNGVASSITGSPLNYAYGGFGDNSPSPSAPLGPPTNRGFGGNKNGNNSGSGIVVIRYKFQ